MARIGTGGRARAIVFLGLSLAAALGAVAVVGSMMQSYDEALRVASIRHLQPVVTVVVDVDAGTALTEEHLGVIDVELEFAPDGTFDEPQEAVGRIARERLLAGELLRVERLAPAGSRAGLGVLIPGGMRAVGVTVGHSSAVAGFLNPGNHVDVVVTIADEQDRRLIHTRTILQSMRVLAIEDRYVTLAATPEEAALLAHGQSEGELTLTLRNDRDLQQFDLTGKASRR